MTARQVVEIKCDCQAKVCAGSHKTGNPCLETKSIQTNSMVTARWTALVSEAWALDTEPRNGYGGRVAGRKVVGDRCRLVHRLGRHRGRGSRHPRRARAAQRE